MAIAIVMALRLADLWRFAVRNVDGVWSYADSLWCQWIGICVPVKNFVPVVGYSSDTLIDPRANEYVIATLFTGVWAFWTRVELTYELYCRTVYTWWWSPRYLCSS